MIFRAMVSKPIGWHEKNPQQVVFIEASSRDEARTSLRGTLASLWNVEPECLYWENMESEFDLFSYSTDEATVGDHRLFLTGSWQFKPIFVDGTPLFLLSSELDRVMRAYITLPREKAVV